MQNASDRDRGGRCEEGKHEMKKGKGGSRRREASVSHSIHHALVQRRALSKPAVEGGRTWRCSAKAVGEKANRGGGGEIPSQRDVSAPSRRVLRLGLSETSV